MKKEDMKKPCKGEKTGLKIELNKFNLILIAFLFSIKIFPQIPINGFCKYNSNKTDSGFNNILPINFNGDSYNDLILFNPNRKEIVSLAGDFDGSFKNQLKFDIPYEISNLNQLLDKNNNVTGYAFTSRRGMSAGIFNFLEDGKPVLYNEIKFQSYPENISSADINGFGEEEILISGSGFDGLSILAANEKGFDERKIISGSNFSEAVFADLNNDGISDIAAFDLMEGSLIFFYNNSQGDFRKARSIELHEKIFSLRSFDLNLDDYEDLIFVKGNGMFIMYGDYMSSYTNTVFIETSFYPHKFIPGDFNRDGRIDIAYLNYEESIVSLIFGKDEFEFYPEIKYLNKKEIKNLIPYYSKFISGIAVISEEGKIFTITKLSSLSSNVDLSLGIKPSAINYFENDNNGIINICFIDEYDSSLKVIIRSNAGLPAFYYSHPLFEHHSEILVDNSLPNIKTFYCFSYNKKLIEVLRIDFKKNTSKRYSLYSPGPIKDLRFLRTKGNNGELYTAYIKENKLGLTSFSYVDNKYSSYSMDDISNQAKNLAVSLTNDFSLYFWGKNNGSITLIKTSLENKAREIIFDLPVKGNITITSFAGDLLNKDKEIIIGFINASQNKKTIIAGDSLIAIITDKKFLERINVRNKTQLFLGEIKINGLKRLLVYNPEKRTVYKIEFIKKGKEAAASKLIDGTDIRRYFVKNMSFKNYHIVYSNKENNCISIRKI